jgi:hypothetical protein
MATNVRATRRKCASHLRLALLVDVCSDSTFLFRCIKPTTLRRAKTVIMLVQDTTSQAWPRRFCSGKYPR